MNHFKHQLCAQLLRRLAAVGIALTGSLGFAAQDEETRDHVSDSGWRLEFSPFTHHYRFDADHKLVWAVGLEREAPDRALYGVTAFSNSFGQPSAYGYYGRIYNRVWDRFDALYLKWTIGAIYGYKVPFDDKIMFNHYGFAPAIIPAVGWRLSKDWSAQVNFLGTAAMMVMVSKKL